MNENLLIIKLPDFNLNCSAQKILILKIQLLQLYQQLLSLYFARMPCTEFSKCQNASCEYLRAYYQKQKNDVTKFIFDSKMELILYLGNMLQNLIDYICIEQKQ
ncbi:Hypothetical_protein [Hexamita inflata]|uniref:Hypothetical_protein n=1 Tax=Hexamita inflata TaxID=28002 RepID=A0AA86PRV7_9EUKA|nr:Hypothetical protein HINF_LOCUS29978 [Hexamita inflata]